MATSNGRKRRGQQISPDFSGRIGGIRVSVFVTGPAHEPTNIRVMWLTPVLKGTHEEIDRACRAYCSAGYYREMTLSEYLNKMFDAEDYSKEIL